MDLLRRVRWGNVARAAALLTAVALVVAWPRLRSAPPPLPPEPQLVTSREEGPEFGLEQPPPARAGTSTVERRRPAARSTPRRHRAKARRRQARRRRATTPRTPATHTTAPAPAPRRAGPVRPSPAWRPPPAGDEFGFE